LRQTWSRRIIVVSNSATIPVKRLTNPVVGGAVAAMSGDVLVALLAVVVAGYGGQADTGAGVQVVGGQTADTERTATTTTSTSASTSSTPAAKYLPRMTPVQEPADPCKAGNYASTVLSVIWTCAWDWK